MGEAAGFLVVLGAGLCRIGGVGPLRRGRTLSEPGRRAEPRKVGPDVYRDFALLKISLSSTPGSPMNRDLRYAPRLRALGWPR